MRIRRLAPHEADDLDVILLGHSLGGILAAGVVLLQEPGQAKRKHRILGTVNFDVPFLGLHPRVIPTGVSGSIPKKDVAVDDEESLGFNPPSKPITPNPYFDPPFKNDVRLAQRGFLKGIMHFVDKNTDHLSRSIFDRVISPVKFANCVNNHSALRRQYRHLVELEEAECRPDRVRFVNYYTASTGRISPKTKPERADDDQHTTGSSLEETTPLPSQECPEVSNTSDETETAMVDTDTLPPDGPNQIAVRSDSTLAVDEAGSGKTQPPPDTAGVASSTTDLNETQSLSESVSPSISTTESGSNPKQKLRKFILLPSHHWRHSDNARWTPIRMEDMDEVTAHQSLFVPHGKHYDYLVGDTVDLIEQWIQSDLSRRLVQEGLD